MDLCKYGPCDHCTADFQAIIQRNADITEVSEVQIEGRVTTLIIARELAIINTIKLAIAVIIGKF